MDLVKYEEHQLEISQDKKYMLDIVKEKRDILNTVLERKKRRLGRILRGVSLVIEVIEVRREGKKATYHVAV